MAKNKSFVGVSGDVLKEIRNQISSDIDIDNFLDAIVKEIDYFIQCFETEDTPNDLDRNSTKIALRDINKSVDSLIEALSEDTAKLSVGQLSNLTSYFLVEQKLYNKNYISQDVRNILKILKHASSSWIDSLNARKGQSADRYIEQNFARLVYKLWDVHVDSPITKYSDNPFWLTLNVLLRCIDVEIDDSRSSFANFLGIQN